MGSLALGNDSAPGTYSVCTLWIKDSVASTPNLRVYRESELIELGYTLGVSVENSGADTTDPELTSFAIEPASQIISTESENLT